jgi:hypothetical protein
MHKSVEMKLLDATVQDVGRLSELFETNNRADVVARSVQIALLVMAAIKSGKTVQLVAADGTRETLVVPL